MLTQLQWDLANQRGLENQIDGAVSMVVTPGAYTDMAAWRRALAGYVARAQACADHCAKRARQARAMTPDSRIAPAWQADAETWQAMADYGKACL